MGKLDPLKYIPVVNSLQSESNLVERRRWCKSVKCGEFIYLKLGLGSTGEC